MTRAEALAFGQNLDRLYPRWLEVIPPCPCTYAAAQADASNWNFSGFRDAITLPIYHPGAAHEVRSARGYQSVAGTSHGQQCCYDEGGNLITEGPAAGTPDVWSPVTHFGNHQRFDVDTFNLLGWRVYTQYWRPNLGPSGRCPPNAGRGVRIGSGRFRIVGAFQEIDLFILSIPQRTVTVAENVIVVETGRSTGDQVGGRGHYTLIEVLPESSSAVALFGNQEPRYVPDYLLQPVP